MVSRWADHLRVFWALSGSRKWRAGLASDLRLLRCAAEVTRGGALGVLPSEWQSVADWREVSADKWGEAPNALSRSLVEFRRHVLSGAVLSVEQTEAADSALEIMRGGRAASTGATARKRWAVACGCPAAAAAMGADVCATLHGVSA